MADNIPRDPVVPEDGVPRDEESMELRTAIGIGMDMEMFLESDVGKLLRGRAAHEIRELQEQFEEVNPADTKAVLALQMGIAVRRLWRTWIKEAIEEGHTAQQQAVERGRL